LEGNFARLNECGYTESKSKKNIIQPMAGRIRSLSTHVSVKKFIAPQAGIRSQPPGAQLPFNDSA